MMKKIFICVLMSAFLFLSSCSNNQGNIAKSGEQFDTHAMCSDCAYMAYALCAEEESYEATAIHKPFFGEECSVDYYFSRSCDICASCERVQTWYGNHVCLEIHSSCGKGRKKLCPVG